MQDIVPPDDIYEAILLAMRFYACEAHKCREGKAYLAGCVMAGAALEAALLVTAICLSDEAAVSKAAPHKRGAVKPFVDWSLFELLAVAKERNWLPASLSLQDDWDTAKTQIGDYAEALRMIRNLVHPVRYAVDLGHKRVTKRYLESSFRIMDAANEYLMNKMLQSMGSIADGTCKE
jgi:hypothetical protein